MTTKTVELFNRKIKLIIPELLIDLNITKSETARHYMSLLV